MQISYFLPTKTPQGDYVPGTKPKESMSLEAYFDGIKNGRWEIDVMAYREGKRQKSSVPAVTPSGTFTTRSANNIVLHSGVIVLDFDAKDNGYFPADAVATDPYVLAFHKSVSGNGYAVYVRIVPEKHKESFEALEKHFADTYQVMLDPSGKDVSRLRYVSHDPDLWYNPNARIWKKEIKKKPQSFPQFYVYSTSDIDFTVSQIRQRGVNLCDSYHDWIKAGMALANELGEGGRQHFHAISAMSGKYDAANTDKKFSHLLKSGRGDVKIGTLFFMAKQAGCEIKSKRTEHIERVAVLRAVSVGKTGGHPTKDDAKQSAKRILEEQDGMQGSDIDEVIDKVFDLPESELQVDRKDVVSDLKEFLRQYDFRYNEITGKVEISGVPVSDRSINSIWVKAMEAFSGSKKAISKEVLVSIIESDFVPQYNPIRQFFLDNANIKPEGQIDALIASLKVADLQSSESGKNWSGQVFCNAFLRKWLLSCVASWHGTYSVMMAVLTGAQAAGKTNFFRKLLPDELKQYYADNKLDKGDKDDLLLMATKAIICDDEFSGKSKQDYKMLKELISKQTITIRRPFGRFAEDLQRIAVLCGCSNEPEIINDPTGNRRIIPIPVIEIDWDKYNAVDKTALWMELYHEWRQMGEGWMLTKNEVKLLNELTTKAHQVATEEEAIWMFFQHPKDGGLTEWMTNTEIRNYIETNSRLHISGQKLGIFLAKHDFERKGVRSGNGTKYVYGVVKRRNFSSAGDDLL